MQQHRNNKVHRTAYTGSSTLLRDAPWAPWHMRPCNQCAPIAYRYMLQRPACANSARIACSERLPPPHEPSMTNDERPHAATDMMCFCIRQSHLDADRAMAAWQPCPKLDASRAFPHRGLPAGCLAGGAWDAYFGHHDRIVVLGREVDRIRNAQLDELHRVLDV